MMLKKKILIKLVDDVTSVKVWVLWASIGLLMAGYITGANFTAIVSFVLAGRAYDTYRNTTES